MKKTISIRALLIALMLTITFAIPAAPAASQPSLIEAAQAVSAEPAV